VKLKDILEGRKPDYAMSAIEEALGVEKGERGVGSYFDVVRTKEALSASDFPILFGDTLQRILLKSYKETPQTYQALVKNATVPDFRNVKRFRVTGGDGQLSKVLPSGEYELTDRGEAKYEYHVDKYGKKFDINWEAFINDDLDALKDQPERFGRGARRSMQRFVTSMFANNTSFFSEAHDNLGTGALSIPSLQGGVLSMRCKTENGEPIFNAPKFLVVPPSLEVTAKNILNATTVWWVGGASGSLAPQPTGNWTPADLTLIVDDYLPLVDTVHGDTGWYLFSDPNDVAAIEFDLLRGHESPEVFMKVPDAMRVGGGAASPFDGSFDNDSIEYKVRHVWGGGLMDEMGAYMSTGAQA
jgi:hypothetical protein